MTARAGITAILILVSGLATGQSGFRLVLDTTSLGNSSPIPLDGPVNLVAVGETGNYVIVSRADNFFYASNFSSFGFEQRPFSGPTDNYAIAGIYPDPGAPNSLEGAWMLGWDTDRFNTDTEPVFADPQTAPYFEQVDQALSRLFAFDLSVNGCSISRVSYNWEIHPKQVFVQGLSGGGFMDLPGVFVITLEIFVHCMGRNNFVLYATVTNDENNGEVDLELEQIVEASPKRLATKGSLSVPPAALPPGQASRGENGTPIFAYMGQSLSGGASPLATVVWLDDAFVPAEILQLEDTPVGFATDLQLCGQLTQSHIWLAFTDNQDRARLARIRSPQDFEVFDLGPTTGLTALDCDTWGNAVAAFASPTGDMVNLRAFTASGQSPVSTSIPVEGGQSFLPIDLDMNHNGQIVVLWSTGAGMFHQRVELENVVEVDMSFAGSWYSPFFNGEGFIWDIADVGGERTLALYYFTYRPDDSGRQAWLVGSAAVENGVATIPMVITSGGVFGSAYDPDAVSLNDWGSIQVQIFGCTTAVISIRSPLFGDFSYPIEKFTSAGLPGICAAPSSSAKGLAQVDGSFTGSWFSPDRVSEGFIFDVTESNGAPTLVIYWFSYTTDSSGRQLWLVGSAPLNGSSATADLVSASGTVFGPSFNPGNVALTPFGSVTVTFNSCNSASVSYNVNGGESDSFNIQRLAPLPKGAGGECGS